MKVGVHQGSALSLFEFIFVMDELTKEIQEEAPWHMMFADDVVLIGENKHVLEDKLEWWTGVLEMEWVRNKWSEDGVIGI